MLKFLFIIVLCSTLLVQSYPAEGLEGVDPNAANTVITGDKEVVEDTKDNEKDKSEITETKADEKKTEAKQPTEEASKITEKVPTGGSGEVPSEPEIKEAPYKSCPITDHYCYHSSVDQISQAPVTNITECNKACQNSDTCKFFTFYFQRGMASCFLLKSCSKKRLPCHTPDNCVTGRKSCSSIPSCPKLEFKTGAFTHWNCEGFNPYKGIIPEGTVCTSTCPTWKTISGKQVTLMSRCTQKTWSKPLVFPAGVLTDPTVVQSPDKGDLACNPQMCGDLSLSYNPNKEPGADFYCNPPITSWDNLPVKISGNQKCLLLCDKRPVARLECIKGSWTGQPSDGMWCNKEKGPLTIWRAR